MGIFQQGYLKSHEICQLGQVNFVCLFFFASLRALCGTDCQEQLHFGASYSEFTGF
jgi:hypothetical protein